MIREWVSNLFIVIVSLTFIEILLPDSSVSKYLRFILLTGDNGHSHLSAGGFNK